MYEDEFGEFCMLILGLKELNNVALLVNVHVPEEKAQTQKSALVRGPDCWFSELQYTPSEDSD